MQQLYDKPLVEVPADVASAGEGSSETVAFFGLVTQGQALWAASNDGVDRLEADDTVHATPLPAFKTLGGIDVSFELPNLVLVLTEVNRRKSVSGKAPMLVAR